MRARIYKRYFFLPSFVRSFLPSSLPSCLPSSFFISICFAKCPNSPGLASDTASGCLTFQASQFQSDVKKYSCSQVSPSHKTRLQVISINRLGLPNPIFTLKFAHPAEYHQLQPLLADTGDVKASG